MSTVYQALASTLRSILNLTVTEPNDIQQEWILRHEARLADIMSDAPRGSGINTGTTLSRRTSDANKLVFMLSFHHMDGNGFYTEWTDHIVTVTPDLVSGVEIKISGRNKNEIKDYLAETYECWLTSDEPTA